jgi:hypothetical protein
MNLNKMVDDVSNVRQKDRRNSSNTCNRNRARVISGDDDDNMIARNQFAAKLKKQET